MKLNWLLAFVPIAIGLDHWGVNPIAVFVASAAATVPLAKLMEQATETLAHYLGPTYGGLLNATMGNAPELIIGITALRHGLVEVLKGSIAGSVIGTLLFGVGATMIAGGLRKPVQHFDRDMVAVNSAMLMLATFGLVIPASFHFGIATDRDISLEISVILLLVYVAAMVHTMKAKRPSMGIAAVEEELEERGRAPPELLTAEASPLWGRNVALCILAAVTVVLAIVSDLLTGSIQPAADALGLTPVFAGVFLLAMVGNIPQYMNSIAFATKDQMTLALSINLGATTQLVALVAPLLVIAGALMGLNMNLRFTSFELVGVILSVIIVRSMIADASSNWLEGVLLIGVYLMLGFGFFHIPATPS
jgi:Ca2+:H+ antiporter